MKDTQKFVNQFIRKEDKLLTLDELISKYRVNNESRYIAEIYDRMKCSIKIINQKFPSIDEETKDDMALFNVYQALEKYNKNNGSFITLFSFIHNSDLVNKLNYELTQKNKSNINCISIYQSFDDEDNNDESSLIFKLQSNDDSIENIIYKESVLNDKRLGEKEKKLVKFLFENEGASVNEQLAFMKVSAPTLTIIKNNLKKTLEII